MAAVVLNSSGKAISSQWFQPKVAGVYPCKKPTNLGYGAHICR